MSSVRLVFDPEAQTRRELTAEGRVEDGPNGEGILPVYRAGTRGASIQFSLIVKSLQLIFKKNTMMDSNLV